MRDGRRHWIVAWLASTAADSRPVCAACFAAIVGAASSTLIAGCSASLPRPPVAQIAQSDYVPVPFSPRVPPVEFIPPRPSKKAVWVDGSWEWSGNRYAWRFGSWVIPPPNAGYTRWVVVRREGDGQLFFAPSVWKDASGKTIEDRSFMNALGPQARARSRPGGPPASRGPAGSSYPADEEPMPGQFVDTGDADDED